MSGRLDGCQPYLRHRASRNADLCKVNPCCSSGIAVSQQEAPFSLLLLLLLLLLDVKVFYPNAASNRKHSSLKSAYVSHENEKKRAYGERIREVEHGLFTPLVFTSYGSTGPEATTFYKRVASLHAAKSGEQYSRIMQLIRCRLSFALLRSSILCIRGTRSSTYRPIKVDLLGLIESEAHLDE